MVLTHIELRGIYPFAPRGRESPYRFMTNFTIKFVKLVFMF